MFIFEALYCRFFLHFNEALIALRLEITLVLFSSFHPFARTLVVLSSSFNSSFPFSFTQLVSRYCVAAVDDVTVVSSLSPVSLCTFDYFFRSSQERP